MISSASACLRGSRASTLYASILVSSVNRSPLMQLVARPAPGARRISRTRSRGLQESVHRPPLFVREFSHGAFCRRPDFDRRPAVAQHKHALPRLLDLANELRELLVGFAERYLL